MKAADEMTLQESEAMTLATRVCLMDKRDLQQYASPLELYLFVADFVGKQTMNFLGTSAEHLDDRHSRIRLSGKDLLFTDIEDVLSAGKEVVLGVRPEFARLHSGVCTGRVYTTLPSGMKTTVKLQAGDAILTAVILGKGDY